ncbi:unnamed protein product [Colias eurytheme]|nr:unnamed protein product [Colias eurytheme]
MRFLLCLAFLALVCAASASHGWSSGWSGPVVYSAPLVYTRRYSSYPAYSYGGWHGGWSGYNGWSGNRGWW